MELPIPRDRFLTAILIGIGALIVLALILFFVRQARVEEVDDSTPSGVVQNYVRALQQNDYERAYGYLAEQAGRPPLDQFSEAFTAYQGDLVDSTAVEVGEINIDPAGQTAVAQVILIRGRQTLFDEGFQEYSTFELVQQNGEWKIHSAPYPFWTFFRPQVPPVDPLPSPTAPLPET